MSKILPFNFEPLQTGEYLVTNCAGFFSYLDSRDDLEQVIKNPHLLELEKKVELSSKLFLASESDIGIKVKSLASGFASRVLQGISIPQLFMIVPTLRCDHDCTYCQVSRVPEDKSGYDLPLESIDNIIDLIVGFNLPKYKIEFQGGEALLRFDYIQAFIEKFSKKVSDEKYEVVVASSLSQLTREMVDWLSPYPVVFSASYDGPEDYHNKNRRHRKVNSYVRFVEGVELVKNVMGNDRISVVTTVTNEILNCPGELISGALELGLDGLFVRPLSPFGFAGYKKYDSYPISSFLKFYEELIVDLAKRERGRGFTEFQALLHLRRIFNRDISGYVDLQSPAGHILGALVFDYNGNVFGSDEARMLHKTHGIDGLVLGNVNREQLKFDTANNRAMLEGSFIFENPGCDECAFQPYCGSDVMHHFGTQMDFIGDKSKSRFCELEKGIFEIIFRLLKNDFQVRDMFEAWLDA